jgi:hypothetical protein
MTKIRNYLVTACGFVVLVGAVVLSSPITANSQKAKPSDVNVVNTASNPIPTLAQGTTTIAGNVSVTNTPTVNLASGASVNVTNTPTVNLASGASIGINNTTANPVLVRSVDDAVRQIFQKQVDLIWADGTYGQNTFFSVPSGKRLVIEHVSAIAHDLGQHPTMFRVTTFAGGQQVIHFLVSSSQGESGRQFVASQQMRIYADPGTGVVVGADREFNTGTGTATISVSGYLVDVP